jgi:hypothetical protein
VHPPVSHSGRWSEPGPIYQSRAANSWFLTVPDFVAAGAGGLDRYGLASGQPRDIDGSCPFLLSNPYERVWGSAGEPPMPIYKVTLYSFLSGMLPLGRSFMFRKAAEQALDSFADLRCGPDRKGFRRLVHPNGICLAGVWKITEPQTIQVISAWAAKLSLSRAIPHVAARHAVAIPDRCRWSESYILP